MRITRGTGFNHDIGLAAQASIDQCMLHRARSEQRVDRQTPLGNIAVGQDDDHHFVIAHRRQDGGLQALDRLPERFAGRVIAQVKTARLVGWIDLLGQDLELARGQDRRAHFDTLGVVFLFQEHIALGTEAGIQRHHDRFADRIDRRVGDLRKLLAQVIKWRAHLLRQHRHRRIVAHRANRFLAILRQHADHLIALFEGQLELLLVSQQLILAPGMQHARITALFELDRVAFDPLAVRVRRLQAVVDGFGIEEFTRLQIGSNDLARLDAAFLHHVFRLVVPHTDFGRDGQVAILGDHIARRAQSVAVQHAAGIAAIGPDDTGRAIPRLHVQRVVFVECAQIAVVAVDVLPRRRHQHAHGAEDVDAAHQQAFEHVVEAHRIRTVGLHDRAHGTHVEMRRFQNRLARLGPQAVAGNRVDLAVVRQEAERLRQLPLWPGIGRETLVVDGERRFKARIAQIRVEHRKVIRRHQALIGNHMRVERRDIKRGIAGIGLLGQTTCGIELTLEAGVIHAIRAIDEHLLEQRQGLERIFATSLDIGRHGTDTGQHQPLRFDGLLEVAKRFVGDMEHQTSSIPLGQRETIFGSDCTQEAVRFAEQEAATIARFAIGRHSTPVGKTGQRINRSGNQPVRRLVVHLRDQAETAAILFKPRAVQRALQPALSVHCVQPLS